VEEGEATGGDPPVLGVRVSEALIAEGRRLIAAATPGPVSRTYCGVRAANGELVAEHTYGSNATLHVFAVNNLAVLLDVAEAGDAVSRSVTMAQEREAKSALDSALSRLRVSRAS